MTSLLHILLLSMGETKRLASCQVPPIPTSRLTPTQLDDLQSFVTGKKVTMVKGKF